MTETTAGQAPGILFARMAPPPETEDAFNEWYETEHVPARLGVPGFVAAHRYKERDAEPDPAYAVVYEMESADVVKGEAYRSMQAATAPRTDAVTGGLRAFHRSIARLHSTAGEDLGDVGHPWLWVVAFSVPDDRAAAFDDWYDTEHVPLLLKAPGWRRTRRYVIESGNDHLTHLALHDIDGPELLDAPERRAAGSTEWRATLAAEPWFGRGARWLFNRISTAKR
ncbi:MAG TPA: hypothetical protein VGM91_14805 [Conexibacter sp.]|jgi:hypothetical protein